MNISWNGLGSILVTAKVGQDDVSVVTNPFVSVGSVKFPKSIAASVVVQSHDGNDANNTDGVSPEHEGEKAPFHIVHAGEYEVRGVFVTGISAPKKDGTPHTIYRFDAEGMHLGFLGAIDRMLTSKEIDALGAIDILFVPAGGGSVLGAALAGQLGAEIEPRIVIPMYVSTGDGDGFADVSAFTREVSAPSETMTKYKITRTALPEEDMNVILLTR
jgi:L-ascorbate metabolism protein UlaG (beta-lactamase superfamily)